MRLPFPYRPESQIVAQRLGSLAGSLDWAAAAKVAPPWVHAVRNNPPPFWAMESLLKEYPISSAEGLALMRLAEALLRVPDAETVIALTADQLGRTVFNPSGRRGARYGWARKWACARTGAGADNGDFRRPLLLRRAWRWQTRCWTCE